MRAMMMALLPLVLVLLCLELLVVAKAAHPDTNPECEVWAQRGECERNSNYMLPNCATSCEAVQKAVDAAAAELDAVASFFALEANDLHGEPIQFSKFQGQVTILTNVASYCGYTESHYHQLVELWSQLRNENINILAFPCNQFGEQEPGTADDIAAFAKSKGVQFTMMEKINVNGPDASLVYKYLKKQTGVDFITWNFATYFVVGPDGSMAQYTGVEPLELKEVALSLLKGDEL